MIDAKITSAIMAINSLAGKVSEGDWEILKSARAELADAAGVANALEHFFTEEQLANIALFHRLEALGMLNTGKQEASNG